MREVLGVCDSGEAIAEGWAGCEPVHLCEVQLARVPVQLAVVLGAVTFRAELDLHCFLSAVGSDQDAVGAATRTLLETAEWVACLLELVAEELPLRDPTRLLVL